MKSNYPQLASRAVQTPAPAILHIIDGRQAKAEAPTARGKAFQLTVEEAHETPNYMDDIVSCVGTFLVNFVPALVLLDSGASRSSMS